MTYLLVHLKCVRRYINFFKMSSKLTARDYHNKTRIAFLVAVVIKKSCRYLLIKLRYPYKNQ